ncbi:MAG TPA: VOC family protein [Gammaproteobacteria bacterium]|jgi:PhnB protein
MKTVNPYLYFNGNTKEAFDFYQSVFGGDFVAVLRYRDFDNNAMGVPEAELEKIAHIALPLGENSMLMGTDALDSQGVSAGNNFHIALEPESAQEADKVFDALSAGGKVNMPLQQTEWAEKHGQCVDRFGIQWIVDYTGNV